MKTKKETIIRTIITALTMTNAILVMLEKNPLPWSEDEVYVGLSAVSAVASTVWSWWKNNSFTTPALLADEYLKEIKRK